MFSTKIDASTLTGWQTAKKVKPLRAKPMADLVADKGVTSKFLVSTLEGVQNIRLDSIVCVGADNDAWQQDRTKLLKNYNVTEITADGWMICTPKPESARRVIEVTSSLSLGEFTLLNTQWGERQDNGTFTQNGNSGDYIVGSLEDLRDFWIVKRSVFINTYEIVVEQPVDISRPRNSVLPTE